MQNEILTNFVLRYAENEGTDSKDHRSSEEESKGEP
jgi:hypothetical protein